MQDIDLTQINNIHFIGVGGIGISAIARMMLSEGKNVSGQDMQDSEILKELKKAGAKISVGQDFAKIPKKTDLVVYTIAIENYDTELFENLKNQEIPIRSYPEMLSIVTKGKYTIAISGTHGKTTTTGMIAQVLKDSGNDPTVVVGSLLVGENTNFISGRSQYFVVEACEYRRSFLNINPNILVITNIDADHLDYYKDMDDIKSAFRELALKVPKDGFVICNPTDPHIIDVVAGIEAQGC
jgi:UDP-N-acetylmuramate--alanine ligase